MKGVVDFLTLAICAALLVWSLGGRERFDCSVMHMEVACAKIAGDYETKP